MTFTSFAECSHVWGENGHCTKSGCTAIRRVLYATKYVQDTVSPSVTRIYTFKPVVSGVYTICTTAAGKSASYIPTGAGDTTTDTYIRVYGNSARTDLLASNDDIAANPNHYAYSTTHLNNGWLNYKSSVTMYFSSSKTYYIQLNKGGTKTNTISYNIHVKSYAGSLMGYFYGNSPSAPISTSLSSEQGNVYRNVVHQGYDIQNNYDYPVYAPCDGVVTDVGGSNSDTRGYFVEIRYYISNGNYEYMRFLHLKTDPSTYVNVDDTVFKDKKIGITGGTGANGAYAVHLHMDIHTGHNKAGTLINPNKYYANTMIYD